MDSAEHVRNCSCPDASTVSGVFVVCPVLHYLALILLETKALPRTGKYLTYQILSCLTFALALSQRFGVLCFLLFLATWLVRS